MWPWLNTAVLSRDGDHRRISSCSKGATTEEPVSTMNSPASVDTAVAFAKLGRKATPSATSTSPPMWLTGWSSPVVISPRQRRSAGPRMCSTTASGARVAARGALCSAESALHDGVRSAALRSGRRLVGLALVLRLVLGGLVVPLFDPLLELGLRRAETAGDLRELRAAEDEQSDGNHDEDHVQAFKRRYLHDPSLAAGRPTDSPRIYPQRWIRGLQPASSTPRTTATIEAVPATDPQTASAGRVLARACSHAAIPARTTIAILTPRTTFQACVEDACTAETFQNPVRIRTRNAGQLDRKSTRLNSSHLGI